MRFAFAHKLSTYLTVATAYFAIALSGELGPIQLVLAFFGIVASWWWEPPRIDYQRWSLFWTILSGLVFAASVLLWLAGGEILLVGTHFLLYLMVTKLFARNQAKDYQQVYVLSFLMLVAGTVLNAGFSFGIFFLGYVVFSTWALILFHLRREMEENFLLKHSEKASERVQVQRILNSKRIVGARFFVGTSLMSLVVFVSATLLFLAIPRIGLGLFFPKRRDGVNMVGFDDKVKLGGHGRLKDDPTIVMRVKVDDSFEGRRAPEIHWRGVAFDQYDGGSWTRSRLAPKTESERDTDIDGNRTYVHMKYDRLALPLGEKDRQLQQGMRQEIYLEPMGTDVLFGASMPEVFSFDGTSPKLNEYVNDELRMNHGAGIKYVVYSRLDRPPAKQLRAAPTQLPVPGQVVSRPNERQRTYRRYLSPPRRIKRSERDAIRALAEEVTRDATNWYDKSVAIESYLRTQYGYTLDMVAPPAGMDPVYFFLFDRKLGHCEYFSSAMVLMLREVGVPSRNVNGFLGGAWNEYDDYIAVRSGDAHSWVEAYFPGSGWVTFDPTPPGQANAMGRGGTGLLEKLQRFMDTMRFKWFKWVIEYDLHQQLKMFNSIRESLSGGKSLKRGFGNVRKWMREHKRTAAIILVLLAVIGFVWFRLRRKKRLLEPLGLDRELSRHRSAIAGVYVTALTRYERRGHKRPMSATAREYATGLERAQVAGARSFKDLTELYYDAIYGANDAPELLARARYLRDACQEAWKTRKQRR